MIENRNIKEGIQRLAGTFGRDYVRTIDCVVTAVDETNRTCSVEPVTGTSITSLDEVKLSAEPNDGLILIPEIDSIVRVAYTEKSERYVIQFSDLQKARVTIGNYEISIDSNGIELNGSEFGGLVKASSVVSKLNKMENLLNLMLVWSATVTPPFTSELLVPTILSDLTNNNVKHG